MSLRSASIKSAGDKSAAKRSGGDRSYGRRIGTQDVVSAWMIYLVFLGGLILLSTISLQNGREEVLLPDGGSPDLALQGDAALLGSDPVPSLAAGRT